MMFGGNGKLTDRDAELQVKQLSDDTIYRKTYRFSGKSTGESMCYSEKNLVIESETQR